MHQHVSRNIIPVRCRIASAWIALLLALGAAACTSDTLLSPDGARPSTSLSPVTSVTPGSALVGDTGVVLTIRGSGFTEFTVMDIDPWLHTTTTFVDDSTLTARIEQPLPYAGTHQVVVFDENWQPSDPHLFTVTNPVPVITRMTPDGCEAGGNCPEVTLHGRNFLPGVEVRWNGYGMNIQRQSDSVITVYLSPYDLMVTELAEVTAVNPAPGGGSSAPAIFQVGMRVQLHTAGATAGGGGFELEIHGESFSSGAVVYWNGSPRQTYVSNARRISAMITAADVAAPGEGVVTLSAPGLMNGQPFRVGTITVRPQQSLTVTSQATLQLPVHALAYSAYTDRLYGTVYEGPDAGNLAVINPQTGSVENLIWVGLEPRYLAVSDDGKYVWVGVDGEHSVRRVNLDYAWPDVMVQLDSGIVAQDLAAVPGKPLAVAVARMHRQSAEHAGVAVYEWFWGSILPSTTAGGQGSNVIEFGATGSTLYGLDTETMDGRYRTMTVDDQGVAVTSTGWRVGLEPGGDFVYAGGRLYTSQGPVIDLGYNDWAGIFGFNNPDGAVRPDVRTGLAYYLSPSGIRVADINTFSTVGMLPVPPLQFEPLSNVRRHLVRWGADGLAWHDADEVFILRSPIVGP
jgi:DNA-binding beta-propeller fold protein YncE